MGVVGCGSGGLVVAHVGRRLLLASTPRQCAMPLLLVGPAPLPVSRGFLFFCDQFIFLLFFPYHICISLDTPYCRQEKLEETRGYLMECPLFLHCSPQSKRWVASRVFASFLLSCESCWCTKETNHPDDFGVVFSCVAFLSKTKDSHAYIHLFVRIQKHKSRILKSTANCPLFRPLFRPPPLPPYVSRPRTFVQVVRPLTVSLFVHTSIPVYLSPSPFLSLSFFIPKQISLHMTRTSFKA